MFKNILLNTQKLLQWNKYSKNKHNFLIKQLVIQKRRFSSWFSDSASLIAPDPQQTAKPSPSLWMKQMNVKHTKYILFSPNPWQAIHSILTKQDDCLASTHLVFGCFVVSFLNPQDKPCTPSPSWSFKNQTWWKGRIGLSNCMLSG